jgi:hypothetical protein
MLGRRLMKDEKLSFYKKGMKLIFLVVFKGVWAY